jgi:hypothetical protein
MNSKNKPQSPKKNQDAQPLKLPPAPNPFAIPPLPRSAQTPAQKEILALISEYGPLSETSLARSLDTPQNKVRRTLSTLAAHALVHQDATNYLLWHYGPAPEQRHVQLLFSLQQVLVSLYKTCLPIITSPSSSSTLVAQLEDLLDQSQTAIAQLAESLEEIIRFNNPEYFYSKSPTDDKTPPSIGGASARNN